MEKENLSFAAPKGLRFSDTLVKEALDLENLTKDERKQRVDEIKEAMMTLKEEFIDLKAKLRSIIKETLNTMDQEYVDAVSKIKDDAAKRIEAIEQNFASIETPSKKEVTEYKNSIKGIKFVTKRSLIKLREENESKVAAEKGNIEDLYVDYGVMMKAIKGKASPLLDMQKRIDVFYSTFSLKKALSNRQTWINLIPLFMLIALVIAFYAVLPINNYGGGIDDVINRIVFVTIVSIGAVFIYSSGSFDMSLGSASLMCACITSLLWSVTHNIWLSFLVAILFGAMLGIINAFLANVLNLPVMVMTLTMMNILNSIHSIILASYGGQINIGTSMLPDLIIGGYKISTIVYASFIVGFFLLLWAIFNYTKIGRRNKFIGSNRTAAKYNGISLMKTGIISFAISGIGLGICGFLFATKLVGSNGEVFYSGSSELASIGLNVVVAIVFGGMTTSGGPRSRVSCALVGAFFCSFLDEFFNALNLTDWAVLAKGAVFLIVAFFNMYSSRPKKMLASGMGGF